jgi:hypothetical protein
MSKKERREELQTTAVHNRQIAILMQEGHLDFLANDDATTQFVELSFSEDLAEHDAEHCRCDLTNGGYGLCYIGQWQEGLRTSWEIIAEMSPDYFYSRFVDFSASA